MKVRSLIKFLCSCMLLLGTLGSYGSVQKPLPYPAATVQDDAGDVSHIISSAFAILEQGVMPGEVSGPAGAVTTQRHSTMLLPSYTAYSSGICSAYSLCLIHYHHERTQAGSSIPLFLSVRRLLL